MSRERVLDVLKTAGGWLLAALAWLGRLIAALLWFAVFALLRVLEVSKRGWAVAAVIGLLCLCPVYLALWVDGWIYTLLVVLVLGIWILVAARPAWVDYRRKLAFLAEAQPRQRCLLVDAELYAKLGGVGRGWAALVAAGLVLFVVLEAWREAGAGFQSLVAGSVMALALVGFLAWGIVLWDMERRHGVRYYVRGWRIAEPEALEEKLAGWHLFGQAVERRRRWGGWLARHLGGVIAPLAQPYGACAEVTMP